MNTKFFKTLATAGIILAGMQTAAFAAFPPYGMVAFCQSNPSQCRADATSKITLTDDLVALLQRVNTRVNGSIRPQNDSGRDRWSLNPSRGDCDDYVVTKRAHLIRAGVPAGALRIATTKTRRGEPHAILVVKTSHGDLVLDNLSASVKKLGSTGYRIHSMSTQNPMVWAS